MQPEHEPARGRIRLRHYADSIEFPLGDGSLSAMITPCADNLRRVLEACAGP